ncbi:hypothetical protein CES85_5125 [Ochrobactrum quorumnocens]|uniref:Uncharacterized protein n=1 Tax=Ochrobactrum quorumnocens TaxID=271865 RepID=A0A248UD77_9HYPH|nr:hypothetical protein CES85_5125 [[Ochrobactrum] quorumnocens]
MIAIAAPIGRQFFNTSLAIGFAHVLRIAIQVSHFLVKDQQY